jgi:hypothetical protein
VELDADGVKVLQRHLESQQALMKRVGSRYHDEGLIFAREEMHLTAIRDNQTA